MEKLNRKKQITLGGVAACALLSGALVWGLFVPAIQRARKSLEKNGRILREYEEFLAQKAGLESQWETQKTFFQSPLRSEEFLNAWIKDLLTYAQSEGLTIEKLEPAGMKEGPEGKEMAVFVSFQGDIARLVQFVYHLVETDPLAGIESFLARQDENGKTLSFEMMLGKKVK